MESKLSAEEVWEQIERQHDPEKNRVANTYAITLNNGITYLYSVSHDNRLLSIDDWFEGYVCQYGTIESGFPYAIKNGRGALSIYKIESKDQESLLLSFDKKSSVYKYWKTNKQNRIALVDCYWRNGKDAFLSIVSSEAGRQIYSLNTKEIIDKYNKSFKDKSHCRILFRLPFYPCRFAIGKRCFLDDKQYDIIRLIDQGSSALFRHLSTFTYNFVEIGEEIGGGIYPIYSNSNRRIGSFIRCTDINKTIELYEIDYTKEKLTILPSLSYNISTKSVEPNDNEIIDYLPTHIVGLIEKEYERLQKARVKRALQKTSVDTLYNFPTIENIEADFTIRVYMRGQKRQLMSIYNKLISPSRSFSYTNKQALLGGCQGKYRLHLLQGKKTLDFTNGNITDLNQAKALTSIKKTYFVDLKTEIENIEIVNPSTKEESLDIRVSVKIPKILVD